MVKDGQEKKVDDIGKYYGMTTVSSIVAAKKIQPDVVFVTNPSSLHISSAKEFAALGSDLFIEKPLGHSTVGLSELERIVRSNKLVTMVGFQTRFNPLIEHIKKLVEKREDNIISAAFEWNTYLPVHHKYEDYSKGYAARKDLGGGVVLGLIHEIDLLYYLLGTPKKMVAVGGKLSDLHMNAEDTVATILTYQKKRKLIPVTLRLSYAQTKEVRVFQFQFTDSTLFVDGMKNSYALYDEKGKLVEKKTDPTIRNELFKKEILYFFNCVKKRTQPITNIFEARKSLELALEIKKQIAK
jgi:predicted dehydrogenase